VPVSPLHTNFKLDSAGGYLALVNPDGTTIASQFAYGEQRADISYGLSRRIDPVPLIGTNARVRVLVPSSHSAGLAWTGGEPFDDSTWLAATNGVGFDQSPDGSTGLTAWWNFDDASNPALARDASGGNHHATITGTPAYTADAGGRSGQPG